MLYAIGVSLLVVCAYAESSLKNFDWETYSKTNHFTKRSPAVGIYFGGRLTERQIGYIASSNFSSIVSVEMFSTNSEYHHMNDVWPSSFDEIDIALSYGLNMTALAPEYDLESFHQFCETLIYAPKPVYVHSGAGYSAALLTLLYLQQSGTIIADDIYNLGYSFGYEFLVDPLAVDFIEEVTGLVATPLKEATIELTFTKGEQSYKDYYWTHRMGGADTFYNAGQILSNQVEAITGAGYKSIINFRTDGEPTNLLPDENMNSGTIPNYEFSDSNGYYNLTLEQETFVNAGLKYYSLPTSGWTKDTFMSYLPTLEAAEAAGGPILVHCASGYRSAGYILTYMAYKQGLCTNWFLSEATKIGYSYDVSPGDAAVVQFAQSVLGC